MSLFVISQKEKKIAANGKRTGRVHPCSNRWRRLHTRRPGWMPLASSGDGDHVQQLTSRRRISSRTLARSWFFFFSFSGGRAEAAAHGARDRRTSLALSAAERASVPTLVTPRLVILDSSVARNLLATSRTPVRCYGL